MCSLLSKLRERDKKKGIFEQTQSNVCYPTGFVPFDFRNGYVLEAKNDNDEILDSYENVGITGGSFITIVGKSGTAKTTFACQMASNVVRDIPNAFVMHYDLEQAMSLTRIRQLSGFATKDFKEKYILKQEDSYLEDIMETIEEIIKVKEENQDEFKVNIGKLDEFGSPIRVYVPTILIIDSIPTLISKRVKVNEMEGATYNGRLASEISQFYTKLMPVIKKFNITVIAINHIKTKYDIGGFAKQPDLMFLKSDESLPGGKAPIYYAHNILKFTSYGIKECEEAGFSGFKVQCQLLKSRTNKAGKIAYLVYKQDSGFSPLLSMMEDASKNEQLTGREPYKRFVSDDSVKFDSRKIEELVVEKPELLTHVFKSCTDYLRESSMYKGTNEVTKEMNADILAHIMTDIGDEEEQK